MPSEPLTDDLRSAEPKAKEEGLPDRFDYELRAIEADRHAETTHNVSMADGWRDIARGYRLLADFVAHEQAVGLDRHESSLKPPRRGRLTFRRKQPPEETGP